MSQDDDPAVPSLLRDAIGRLLADLAKPQSSPSGAQTAKMLADLRSSQSRAKFLGNAIGAASRRSPDNMAKAAMASLASRGAMSPEDISRQIENARRGFRETFSLDDMSGNSARPFDLTHWLNEPTEAHSSDPGKAQDTVPFEADRRTKGEQAVLRAVRHLWPNGVPAGMTNKTRDQKINEWARAHGLGRTFSASTIQRALRAAR